MTIMAVYTYLFRHQQGPIIIIYYRNICLLFFVWRHQATIGSFQNLQKITPSKMETNKELFMEFGGYVIFHM